MGKEVRVYLDVSIGGSRAGRLVFRLYSGVPKTTENFRSLCTGERGLGRSTGKPLHYKKVPFHRIVKGFMLQGGDFSNRDGTGGESIYGAKFADESFRYRHTRAGLLSMANAGKDTNGSQFFITTVPTPHLDGKHVVFGELEKGMDVVRKMEDVETVANNKPAPMQAVVIEDCGEVGGAGDSESSSDDDSEGKRKRKKLKKEKKEMKKQERKEKKRARKEDKAAKKLAKRRRREEREGDKEQKRRRAEVPGCSRDQERDLSSKRHGRVERDERREKARRASRRSPLFQQQHIISLENRKSKEQWFSTERSITQCGANDLDESDESDENSSDESDGDDDDGENSREKDGDEDPEEDIREESHSNDELVQITSELDPKKIRRKLTLLENNVLQLELAVKVRVLDSAWAAKYLFRLNPLALERVDILKAKLRDLEDELAETRKSLVQEDDLHLTANSGSVQDLDENG
ncbi:hypothetical protein PHYPSEUDO_008640 [Phytophthora pseudosyringae]|uniref:peptidylprolyl isomerase n=1 Tax=Phytophthora pseudosyringae TaxID=221518 RepID=A0A8T1WA43_9STRA|nr:hypothetical protein PHYPSEUDO_008640 [Phytophthora pseudosyringae]